MQCNSMQDLHARLTGEDLSHFDIYIYIYICSVMVCNASVVD